MDAGGVAEVMVQTSTQLLSIGTRPTPKAPGGAPGCGCTSGLLMGPTGHPQNSVTPDSCPRGQHKPAQQPASTCRGCSICVTSLTMRGCVGLFQTSHVQGRVYVSACLYLHTRKHIDIPQHHNNQLPARRQQGQPWLYPETGLALIPNLTLPSRDSPLLSRVTHSDVHHLKTRMERLLNCKHFFSSNLSPIFSPIGCSLSNFFGFWQQSLMRLK